MTLPSPRHSKFTVISLLLVLLSSCARQPPLSNSLGNVEFVREAGGIQEYRLRSNGLRVLLKEDHTFPVITTMMVYGAGFRDETAPYAPGTAHLLEHLVMKSTRQFNKQAGTEQFKVLQGIGASMNATTREDKTQYYETFPKEHIDLALRVERERMRFVLFRPDEINQEKQIVLSELENMANSPALLSHDAVWSRAFQQHPYRFSQIKFRRKIASITPAQVKSFYDRFYRPSNAHLIVAGDFNSSEVLRKIDGAFSDLEPIQTVSREFIQEPVQTQTRRLMLRTHDPLRMVMVSYKIPEGRNTDSIAVLLLAQILTGGKSSRLYHALVAQNLASEVASDTSWLHDRGLLTVSAVLAAGAKHAGIRKRIIEAYQSIQRDGVSDDELERAKNKLRSQFVYSQETAAQAASELAEAIGVGDWTLYPRFLELVDSVTAQDIQRAARKYLRPEKLTAGYLFSYVKPQDFRKNFDSGNESQPDEAIAEKIQGEIASLKLSLPKDSNENLIQTDLISHASRESINGTNLVSMPLNGKGTVAFAGSITLPQKLSAENFTAAEMLAEMLGAQTEKRSAREINLLLDESGTSVSFEFQHGKIRFSVRTLSENMPLAVRLLAEMIQRAVFDEQEFNNAKGRMISEFERKKSEPSEIGYLEWKRLAHSNNPENVNFEPSFDEKISFLQLMTAGDLTVFYRELLKTAGIKLVAVGDFESLELMRAIRSEFSQSTAVEAKNEPPLDKPLPSAQEKFITISGKQSIETFLGHALPLNRASEDFPAVYFANYVLGGDFSGKLTQRVRVDHALSYRIFSHLAGMQNGDDGHWVVNFIAPKENTARALNETKKIINKWLERGISKEELERSKSAIVGNYNVDLASIEALAGRILDYEESGLGYAEVETFPHRIKNLTLADVNSAVKRYFNTSRLITLSAGSKES